MDALFVTDLCSSLSPFCSNFIGVMSSSEMQCFTVLSELKRVFSALQLAWPETLTSVVGQGVHPVRNRLRRVMRESGSSNWTFSIRAYRRVMPVDFWSFSNL